MFAMRLFGSLEMPNRVSPPRKPGRKTRALLAYLAATAKPHTRTHLTEMFCASAVDPAGSLRWHLSRIRRLGSDIIETTRHSVAINSALTTDVGAFAAAIDVDERVRAVQLYTGDLLDGLTLADAPAFELWLLGERARLRHLFVRVATELLEQQIAENRIDEAIPVAKKMLTHESLHEKIHARLMWLYAQSGQREAALAQFDRCRQLLWDELAVEVSAETRTLHEQIQTGRLAPLANSAQPITESAAGRTEIAPFVGRSAEIKTVLTLQRTNTAHTILVEAEAGGGKTRFVHELAHTLAQPLLTATCYDSTRHLPYQPWLALLEERLDSAEPTAVASLPAVWREQLGVLLPDRFPQRAVSNQQHLFRAISAALFDLPLPPPLIFLDDMQWADADSLRLFAWIAQHVRRTRRALLLIGSLRPEEADDAYGLRDLLHELGRAGNLTRLQLPGLNVDHLDELVRRMRPDAVEITPRLHTATRGNPLFVTEILQEPVLGEPLPVPPSLRLLTERRMQQLSDSGRQVLESLAILDRPAHFDLAWKVSGRSEEETIAALEVGQRWRFLEIANQAFDFSHELMRESLLVGISAIRRERLHRRAARALEATGAQAAVLAWHWERAGDPARQAEFAFQAGIDSAELYATAQAIHFFSQAAEHAQTPSQQVAALLKMAEWQAHAGELDSAETTWRHALAHATTPTEKARTLLGLGELAVQRGLYDDALPFLEEALPLYEQSGEPTGIMACCNNLGNAAWWRGQYDIARELFERQRTLARQTDDEQHRAGAHGGLGLVEMRAGNLTAAAHHYTEMLAAAQAAGDRSKQGRALGSIALIHAQRGELVAAVEKWLRSLTILRDIGEQAAVQSTIGNIGRVYAMFGAFDRATWCLIRQLELCLELGIWQNMVIGLTNLAHVLGQRRLHDETITVLQHTIDLAIRLDIPAYLCAAEGGLAETLFKLGRFDEALAMAKSALARATATRREDVEVMCAAIAVEARFALDGDRAAALTALQPIEARWTEPPNRAQLLALRHRIEPTDVAARVEAARLAKMVYEEGFSAEFRTLHHGLTGERLPPPPQLPDGPVPVRTLDSLPAIFAAIHTFITADPSP